MNIEQASMDPGNTLRDRWATMPEFARKGINRARQRRGLAPIASPAPAAPPPPSPVGSGIYWDPNSRHPMRATAGGAWHGRLQEVKVPITRVLIAATAGEAPAAAVGRSLPERIDRAAFGSADELNREPWSLTDGHGGWVLARATKPDLRAHITEVGLVVEWIPDRRRHDHRRVLERIASGHDAASVTMRKVTRRTMRLPDPVDVVTSAMLLDVALLREDERPAYPLARAWIFRDCPRGADELRRQIEVVERAVRRKDR